MYFKNALIVLLLTIPVFGFSQIAIDDVGDGWKARVEKAISLVKDTDSVSYQTLITNCKRIEFIMGDRSTNLPPNTIVINTKDVTSPSINNLAAVLVHESYHLYLWNTSIKFTAREEELMCYLHEYNFLCKLTDVEDWLFLNAVNQIIQLKNTRNK
jgi:hypothetical protein